jgi:hypothetical protein
MYFPKILSSDAAGAAYIYCLSKQEYTTMDFALGILTFGTLGFVAAFAYISARVAEKRRAEGKTQKSKLSSDGWREHRASLAQQQ